MPNHVLLTYTGTAGPLSFPRAGGRDVVFAGDAPVEVPEDLARELLLTRSEEFMRVRRGRRTGTGAEVPTVERIDVEATTTPDDTGGDAEEE
jgi:hypothetical protein